MPILGLLILCVFGFIAVVQVVVFLCKRPALLIGVALVYILFWVVLPWLDHRDPAYHHPRAAQKPERAKSDAERTAEVFHNRDDDDD